MIISLLAIVLPVAIFNLDGSNLISAVLLSVPAGMLPASILGAGLGWCERRFPRPKKIVVRILAGAVLASSRLAARLPISIAGQKPNEHG